jgi:ribonuclease Y
MSLKIVVLLASLAGAVGIGLGYYLRLIISLGKKGSMELEIKEMMLKTKEEAKKIIDGAQGKADEVLNSARAEIKEKEEKIKKSEERIIKKEDLLDQRQADIDKEVENIKTKIAEVKKIKEKVDTLENEKRSELEKIARLSENEAKEELLRSVEKKNEEDILVRMQKLEKFGEEKLERKAQDILATAIQRLGNSVSADVLTTTVAIPNDEIKGKIIGKEGRNIKAFERVTGVEVIVESGTI